MREYVFVPSHAYKAPGSQVLLAQCVNTPIETNLGVRLLRLSKLSAPALRGSKLKAEGADQLRSRRGLHVCDVLLDLLVAPQ